MDYDEFREINQENNANVCPEKSVKNCLDPEVRRSQLPPPPNAFSPLSNPRGRELKCEVCSKPAYLQCSACRVTYYCNVNHQKLDWVGIHERLCSTLTWIRKPLTVICPEEERLKKMEEIRSTRIKMIELAKHTAKKFLFSGNAEAAIPAALQCLKFSSEVYGSGSVELVIPYLLIAEANIWLKQIDQAESHLAQAQWIMFKTQHECNDSVRSAVQRKLGLLFETKGEHQAALECLAQDIYYSSCAFGPNHIRTAGGYFQMAEVFYKLFLSDKDSSSSSSCEDRKMNASRCPQGMINPSATQQIPGFESCRPMPPALLVRERDSCEDIALATNSPLFLSRVYKKPSVLPKPERKDLVADDLYARVVNIWATHLASIIVTKIRRPSVPGECGAEYDELKRIEEKHLDETDAAEAKKMLTSINRHCSRRAALDGAEFCAVAAGRPDPKVRLPVALSMLFWLLGDKATARQYYEDANAAVQKAEKSQRLKTELEYLKDLFEA
ncbi:hypothetical protein Aperf_G00000003991 [Anoplocephala perfoliata]